jgi:site-specific DNA-methyltransferase (adenine-specific)
MIELINIDCMEYMKNVPDKFFDLAIVDPPYGLGIVKKSKLSNLSLKEYKISNWDDSPPNEKYFIELRRISREQIIWGSNYFDGVGLSGGAIVWNKLGNNIGRRNPLPGLSDCEIAYCSMRNNVKMFSYTQIGNVYGNNYQIDWKQGRIHPTQKPVKLYDWLLHNYAKPGQRVIDTHLGSGSSAIAAHYFGVDFVGCELDKDYYDAAVNRFNLATAQQSIFDLTGC